MMLEMLRNGDLPLAPTVLALQLCLCLGINLLVAYKYQYSKAVAVLVAFVPFINIYTTCVYIALAIFHSRKAKNTGNPS
ncbi:hypothetical protein L1285_15060 [Pseudoalteromonas sp. DL2-H2.2]|uniref:hypothetical protein n=1 Tax=Pseudoalteromonas sp. DL2-H2.2 TaxID=2908889 RepID=UPI001F3657D6|nr:hypothetical protein [Pseudoalteromonas sp. DL2-H2.2]MCF2909642.1 hypothetical protein [Pseudoalteromonas sp. DL2-H2.2]